MNPAAHQQCSHLDLIAQDGRRRLRRCTWRQGSKGTMTSQFMVMEVRPAGVAAKKAALDKAGGRASWDGALPVETLIAEWPPHHDEPTDYWLTSLPADTALRHLVRMPKIRWRIEHDYREMKHGLAWTISKAVPGAAGTITSPSSPPPTPS